jgi:hypothetical protein
MMMRKRMVRCMTRPPEGCQTTPVVICSSGRGCGGIGVPNAGAVAHSTAVTTAPTIAVASAIAIASAVATTGSAPSGASSATVSPHGIRSC